MKNGVVKARWPRSVHTLRLATYSDTKQGFTAGKDQGGENVRDHYAAGIFLCRDMPVLSPDMPG
jgi:hypothetical protein